MCWIKVRNFNSSDPRELSLTTYIMSSHKIVKARYEQFEMLKIFRALLFWTGFALSTISAMAAATEEDFSKTDELERARSFQRQADDAFRQSRYQESIALYLNALGIFQRSAFPFESAVIRHQLGFAYLALGDSNNALAQFEANLRYHRQRGDQTSVANYLQYCAQIYSERRDYPTAQRYLEEARALVLKNTARLAEIDHWRAAVAERSNDLVRAREIIESARNQVTESDWTQFLQADAIRLGIDFTTPAGWSHERKAMYLLFAFAISVVVIVFVKITGRVDWLHNIALVVISVALTAGAVEFAIRIFYSQPVEVAHFLHNPNRTTRFVPDASLMPGVNYERTHFTVNEAGIRGDPLPHDDRPRILVVGGSSTEGLFLDDKDAWPQQVQTQINSKRVRPIWIGNAGKSGLNSFSHVVQVHFHNVELQPDLVIIQAGINDLNQCVSGGRGVIRDNSRLIRESDFPIVYRQYVFDRIQPISHQSGMHSRVWSLVEKYLKHRSTPATPVGIDYVIQDEAGRFYAEQRLRRQKASIVDTAPDIRDCLEAYDYNLRRIADSVRRAGVELMFLTQGSLYRSDLLPSEEKMLWFGSVDINPFSKSQENHYYSAGVMEKLLEQYNDVTRSVCREYDLACVDIAVEISHTLDNYYDDVHFNIGGATRVADTMVPAVIAFLTRRNL